ncbi:PREDICTED: antigen-presenting glycoprotein CD1d [Chrysochloris asiatica]|uniref:Antigen-presenting glycoprotein CD1d n=1 Tax=Chrysochloris asiatica TaxID=185453 RepID=A0A9B0TJC9_CHRAS|nr:PREDICTED: antigen-presenting glycoprotein CD1d [Chrysochloris asiatica]
MRILPLLLLWGFPQVWGSSEGEWNEGAKATHYAVAVNHHSVPRENVTLRVLQVSSFINSSWMRTDCSVWLGELQTHSWDNDSDSVHFLLPWSYGNFSAQQWEKLLHVFQVYRISFKSDIEELRKMLQKPYPMEFQVSAGCEVYPWSGLETFFQVAYQGLEILNFKGNSWHPAPEAPSWVQKISKVLNQDQGTKDTIQQLLTDTCPQFVNDLLEAGKSDLEKQEKPEAWLSSGPTPGPGRLLLVCHVSGFYPKPVWVMWMRGEQEEPSTLQGDVLPNADKTWYLRVTVDVVTGEAADLSCRVKHSSLGGQDIVLHWDGSHVSVGWILFAVLASLLLLIIGFILWYRKHRNYEDIL